MQKDIFGDKLTHNIYGRPLKKQTKRQPVSKSQKNEILARQKNKCAHCRKMLDMRAIHFDHIKEVYRGGKSVINNLQALCTECHAIKTHNERLKKVENKRNSKTKKEYWINPLTGKKEIKNNNWSLF